MRTVHFGDLDVSAIGLGCMSMTDSYGISDRDEAAATLARAVELGVTLFDTANTYGAGENEELLGRALAPHREHIVLATKFGFRVKRGGMPYIDGRPDRVEERCDESLGRLGFDHIDLYLLHRPDPNVAIEDTVGAMAELVAKGKVGHIGLCEVNADTLRRAHAVHPIAAVQSEFSLWTRDADDSGVMAACRDLGAGFMPFSPLGRAMLTGAITDESQVTGGSDFRSTLPRFRGEHLDANLVLVEEMNELAAELQLPASQVALAWIAAQGDFIAPIPGTRRRKWLEQNVASTDVTLTADTLARLDEIFAPERVSGERYALSWMKSTDTVADD